MLCFLCRNIIPLFGSVPQFSFKGRRTVYLTDQAVAGFEKIRAHQIEQGFFRPDGFVFLNPSGNPFAAEYYYHIYRDVLKRAGVEYRNFHVLRHPYVKPTTKKYLFILVPMIQLS